MFTSLLHLHHSFLELRGLSIFQVALLRHFLRLLLRCLHAAQELFFQLCCELSCLQLPVPHCQTPGLI